jgi:hypothetical protein
MDELITTAQALKGKGDLKAARCASTRGSIAGLLIYAQGGRALNADGTASAIETDAFQGGRAVVPRTSSRTGLAMTAATSVQAGAERPWARSRSPMTFEGGWLDPAMTGTYPDVNTPGRRCRSVPRASP